jgi:hypothetical protein
MSITMAICLPNPFCTLAPARVVQAAAAPRLSDPSVAAAEFQMSPEFERRLFEAIEPLPIFLKTPRDLADIFARYR